jgi:hypothetical protein
VSPLPKSPKNSPFIQTLHAIISTSFLPADTSKLQLTAMNAVALDDRPSCTAPPKTPRCHSLFVVMT